MPTAKPEFGSLPGRMTLLQRLAAKDTEGVLRELISAVVLKEDTHTDSSDPTPSTVSFPAGRETLLTRDGGYAVRMIADVAMERGTVVMAGDGGFVSCKPCAVGAKPTGVILESVKANDTATVVTGGLARVKVQVGV